MYKVYSQTQNGQIFTCSSCDKIHVEFKNLNFNFDKISELEHLMSYFKKLDGAYWEHKNKASSFRRRIVVPIGHKNFNVMLNEVEVLELQNLFLTYSINKKNAIVDIKKLCSKFCEN